MAKVLKRRWQSNLGGSGLARRDRAPCEYQTYVPDPLSDRRFVLHGDVAADVADAEAAIVRLNAEAQALVDTEALARILLRAEAVASSRIEGLEVGARRLLRAEVVRGLEEASSDVTATEVLRNIDAMVYGVESIGAGESITVTRLLEVHRRLLVGTRLAEHGGHFREEQNWIGGSSYNPCSAAFVPPPQDLVEVLMNDLCASLATTIFPRWLKRPSPMPSLRPSTHSWTATVGQAERSSTSFCAVGGWHFECCHPSHWSLRHRRRVTSMDSPSTGSSGRPIRPRRLTA